MNRTNLLGRKLTYLAILVAMVIPLYLLGQPSGGGADSGGQLAQMRVEYNMAEAGLGEISPASETMKLASLGLRGPAASLLWQKAHRYKVMHEWDRLKATLNNITLLQPHFDKVWEFQAHNLAYNISVQFDDYRQRYEMVREGTEFLTRGVRRNRTAPRLIWYTGWFYGHKLGMSDEKKQFRRLFSEDQVLHESLLSEGIAADSAIGPDGKPDNWLVGQLWLDYGYELVDSGIKLVRQTPLNFFVTGPKWRIKHAEAIEREGVLDARAQYAWERASDDWEAFGNRSIPVTVDQSVKLDGTDDLKLQRSEKVEQLKNLAGDVFAIEQQKRIDQLPEELKSVWQKPESERNEQERQAAVEISARTLPDLKLVATLTDASDRLRALEIVGEIGDIDEGLRMVNNSREQVHYLYWKTLAQAEQEERMVKARRLIYEAELANADAELDKAIELYEEAFESWADIFESYPILVVDDAAEDVYNSIRRYMIAIDTQDLPDDFPLKAFVELMGQDGRVDQATHARLLKEMNEGKKAERQREQDKTKKQESIDSPEAAALDTTAEPKEAVESKDQEDASDDEASQRGGGGENGDSETKPSASEASAGEEEVAEETSE